MDKVPLDYHSAAQQSADGSQQSDAKMAAFLFGSIACLGVPIVGLALRIGPLFLCGGAIAPLVGIFLASMGMRADKRARLACGITLALNALAGMYFFWLFFVRGIC